MSTINRRQILVAGPLAAVGLAAVSASQTKANTLNLPEPDTSPADPRGKFAGKVVLI